MARRRSSTSNNNLSIQEQLKKSTSDLIFEALRESILTGELIPGTALIEKNLALAPKRGLKTDEAETPSTEAETPSANVTANDAKSEKAA